MSSNIDTHNNNKLEHDFIKNKLIYLVPRYRKDYNIYCFAVFDSCFITHAYKIK